MVAYVEFVDMFEALMDTIAQRCDYGQEWITDTKRLTVGDMMKRAETLLKEARGGLHESRSSVSSDL